jgi:hypothetical protein
VKPKRSCKVLIEIVVNILKYIMSILQLPPELFRYIATSGVLSYQDIWKFAQACHLTFVALGTKFWLTIIKERLTEVPLKRTRKQFAYDLDYCYQGLNGVNQAARQGYDKILSNLLKKVEPREQDLFGIVLEHVIISNYTRCFELLFGYHRYLEQALHIAVGHRRFFMIRRLLDELKLNAYSLRAYYWEACETGDRKIIAYLETRVDQPGRDWAIIHLTNHRKLFWSRWKTVTKAAREQALVIAAENDRLDIFRRIAPPRDHNLIRRLLEATLGRSSERVLEYLLEIAPSYLIREVFVPSHQLYCASRKYRDIVDTALTYIDEEKHFASDRYDEYDIIIY